MTRASGFEHIVYFQMTFNPNNPDIRNYIRSVWLLLQTNPSTSAIFGKRKLVFSHKQPKTLKRILSPSKLFPLTKEKPGIKKCNHPRCEICKVLITGDQIKIENKNFSIRSNFSCNSKNILYVISCECGKSYIGETSDFRGRVNLHKNQIATDEYRSLNVSKHLFFSKHSWKIAPFFQCKQSAIERESMESYFCTKFGPSLNSKTS